MHLQEDTASGHINAVLQKRLIGVSIVAIALQFVVHHKVGIVEDSAFQVFHHCRDPQLQRVVVCYHSPYNIRLTKQSHGKSLAHHGGILCLKTSLGITFLQRIAKEGEKGGVGSNRLGTKSLVSLFHQQFHIAHAAHRLYLGKRLQELFTHIMVCADILLAGEIHSYHLDALTVGQVASHPIFLPHIHANQHDEHQRD